jgi:hypothetical protein
MERSTELEAFVQSWFEAATKGDSSVVDRHVSTSQGTRLIGSDPEEWLRGGPDVAEFLRGEVEGAAGSVQFLPNDTEAFHEGAVGWATTRVTIILSDGRRISPRWSSVLLQEDGAWKFVQTHASIGVPNDKIGWEYIV